MSKCELCHYPEGYHSITCPEDKSGTADIIKLTVQAVRSHDQKQRAKIKQSRHDRRLRNTRLLLKHYNHFNTHVDNAIYSVGQINAIDALDEIDGMNSDMYIKSIKKSASLTHVIMSHVKAMLDLYEAFAIRKGEAEQRKLRVLKACYLQELSIADILAQENISERTYLRDRESAINTLSTMIFGIEVIDEITDSMQDGGKMADL